MKFRLPFLAIAAAMVAFAASAQPPAESNALTFGNKLSVASLTSALQAAGYQALVSRPPTSPDSVLGIIATGVNGAKVNMFVFKCDNTKTDEVCLLTFVISFNDDKNILSDALLSAINQKTALVKVTKAIRPADSKLMMNVSYSFPTKEIDDTKFVQPLMQTFAQDVARVAAAYTAAIPPAAPPAAPPAK